MSGIAIQGMGTVFPGGNGLKEFGDYIYGDKNSYKKVKIPLSDSHKPAFLVDEKLWLTSPFKNKLRKANPLSKMAVMSAYEALTDAGIHFDPYDLGLIFTTGLGSQVASFGYQESILSFGESEPSPTKFSHSLHNCAASYVSNLLNVKGPCVTISNFCNSFENGLITAISWLLEDRCKYVLLGAAEVYNSYLGYVFNELYNWPEEFIAAHDKKYNYPGEGGVFFVLQKTKDFKYCHIDYVNDLHRKIQKIVIDVQFDPSCNLNYVDEGAEIVYDFGCYFGHSLVLNAFCTAAGAKMIQTNKLVKSSLVLKEKMPDSFKNNLNAISVLNSKGEGLVSCIDLYSDI